MDIFAGEFFVESGDGLKLSEGIRKKPCYLMLDIVSLGDIQMALDERAAVNLDLCTLTDNFSRVHDVL